MRPPWLPAWGVPLGLAGCFLLAVCASAQQGKKPQLTETEPGLLGSHAPCSGSEPGDPACPHRKKSVTLLPSFTKTTTPMPTHHTTTPHHNTTTHHPTTPHPTTKHHFTTQPHTVTVPHPTTKHHQTTPPHNVTVPHPTTKHHQTTPPHHTSTAHPTTHPSNHTKPHPHTVSPTPTKPPVIPLGNYVVGNGSATCLRVQSGLQIRVRYADQTKKQSWGELTVQPNRTLVTGNCSSHNATLALSFHEGVLSFTFTKSENQETFYLSRVHANVTYSFPQATERNFRADNSSLREFEARLGHSYKCENRTVALTPDFHLQALDEQVQAFQLKEGQFGEAEDCRVQRRRSIVVPLVVGLVLGILVLIVIVAYLVGRRRAHGGYQSL